MFTPPTQGNNPVGPAANVRGLDYPAAHGPFGVRVATATAIPKSAKSAKAAKETKETGKETKPVTTLLVTGTVSELPAAFDGAPYRSAPAPG